MNDFVARMGLVGKVVLITGGAGHVGRAVASAFIEVGARVVIADLPGAGGPAAAGVLGPEVQVLEVDLEQESSVRGLVSRVLACAGRLDVIVHAAALVGTSATDGWVTPFETQTMALWRRALEVNLTAPIALMQEAAPVLRAARGCVVFIGSIYGVVGPDLRIYGDTGMGSPAAYAASKGGLMQMTRWLSTVLAPEVRVNAVSLGGLARGQAAAFVTAYEARTPLGRMGTEHDAAGAVVFLASEAAAWVTGQNLMVDGGWTAW
jgi:NAD(P)-dependent dehydrogenase (short-subunit alcohol dehydrogenase family)